MCAKSNNVWFASFTARAYVLVSVHTVFQVSIRCLSQVFGEDLAPGGIFMLCV